MHGHWGQCAALRSVFISLFTLVAITGARQTDFPLILDVGANIGVCSVLFATMGFASKRDTLNDPHIVTHGILPAVDILKCARVFAIEPDQENFAMLNASLFANQKFHVQDRVVAVNSAVLERAGNVFFATVFIEFWGEYHCATRSLAQSVAGQKAFFQRHCSCAHEYVGQSVAAVL